MSLALYITTELIIKSRWWIW